jgi:DNA-binding transcriptional LysR family regulator
MDLRHLRYFVAVAEEMNMHRAAVRLHISQPPLSLTIKQLEDEIGAALFTREGRGIQITRAGMIYLEHARRILADTDAAGEQARLSHQGITGTLRIGFVSSSISGILQKSVAAYKKKYPGVLLDIRQSNNSIIPGQLEQGQIDVGILRLPEPLPSTLEMKDVWRESWCVALPEKHVLCGQKSVSIKNLDGERLIFYPRWNTPAGYDDVIEMFREHQVSPDIYQEATEQMTIAGLVASGMGIGIVPECMSLIKIPGVTHRLIRNTKGRTGFAFVCRREKDILVENFFKVG